MCSDQGRTDQPEAVETSVLQQDAPQEALATLSRFRGAFYDCLRGREDALFELADALLCTDGPVKTLVDLALAPEHRRRPVRRARAAWTSTGSGGRSLQRRCRKLRTAASFWRSMSRRGFGRTRRPARTARSATRTDAGTPSTRWSPAGRTRSWPRWREAAPPGPRSWMPSAWNPAPTWRPSPPPSSARSSSGRRCRSVAGG